jgi:DNA-binding MarR family transcriptional regulator
MEGMAAHAHDAWHLLTQLFFRQRAALPSLAAELELSTAQMHLLRILHPGAPVAMGRLADSLCCDASNVTGLVDRLETRGLIRRRFSASDRRVKVLELTPAGTRLRAQLLARMTNPPPALCRLSPREQRELVRILSRLVD